LGDKEVVETFDGSTSKYEVVKETFVIQDPKFYVRRDGEPYAGTFSSLSAAVEAAEKAARR